MRFKYREHSQNIIDTSNGLIYSGGNSLCELLNELDGENRELKQRLKELKE